MRAGGTLGARIHRTMRRFPNADPTAERVGIVTAAPVRRKGTQELGVAAAKHHIVGDEGLTQDADHAVHVSFPLGPAKPFKPPQPEVVFKGLPFTLRQVGRFLRILDALENGGGAKPRAEPQKEHAASPVTTQRLHGGIVHDEHRAA